MSTLESKLAASVLHAQLPVGELLARLRRGNETIEQLSAWMTEAQGKLQALERLASTQERLIKAQREEIMLLRAVVRLMEAKERRRLSLADSSLPALLRPQA